jgi:hypothetical protein
MSNREGQSQQSGDASVNIQSKQLKGDVNIQQIVVVAGEGVEPLCEMAAKTVKERLQQFGAMLGPVSDQNRTAWQEKLADPAFVYDAADAARVYARTGDRDLGEMLIDLLDARAAEEERSDEQLYLSEALKTAPRLSSRHCDALTLVFTLRMAYRAVRASSPIEGFGEMLGFLKNTTTPFMKGVAASDSFYQHLAYSGCAAVDVIGQAPSVFKLIRDRYATFFKRGIETAELEKSGIDKQLYTGPLRVVAPLSEGRWWFVCQNFEELTVELRRRFPPDIVETNSDAIKRLYQKSLLSEQEVEQVICKQIPEMKAISRCWSTTFLSKLILTSVGVVIANANYRRKTNGVIDLKNWLSE